MPIFEGSFSSRALKDFYYTGTLKKLPVKNAEKLKHILDYLDTIDRCRQAQCSSGCMSIRAKEKEPGHLI
jgi:hypothetical protein